MKRQTVPTLNLGMPDNIKAQMTLKDGETVGIELRPFNLADDSWMVEKLGDSDLLHTTAKTQDLRNVCLAFAHQLTDESRALFHKAYDIKTEGEDAIVELGMSLYQGLPADNLAENPPAHALMELVAKAQGFSTVPHSEILYKGIGLKKKLGRILWRMLYICGLLFSGYVLGTQLTLYM